MAPSSTRRTKRILIFNQFSAFIIYQGYVSLFTAAGRQHNILTFFGLTLFVIFFFKSVKLQPDQMGTILLKRVGSARLLSIPEANHRRSWTLKLVQLCL